MAKDKLNMTARVEHQHFNEPRIYPAGGAGVDSFLLQVLRNSHREIYAYHS